MLAEDTLIWERFIDSTPDRFTSVQYDVHVGLEDELDEEIEQAARAAWWDLTRWKIDVVAKDEDTIYIIEIKPFANAKALGQALAYALLYQDEHCASRPVVPVVLTNSHINTTQRAGDLMEVRVWVA